MIFLKPDPGGKTAIQEELVAAVQPLFDRGWEKHQEEILRQLSFAANRYSFLNDFVQRQVRQKGWPKLAGAQSFICYDCKDFFIRLNLWFPEKDSPVAEQIKRYFSIGLLHNHNFPLFTVGLFGPGYTTGLFRWENVRYDHKVGEKIDLSFTAEPTLSFGAALFIERDADYHVQFWPEEFSISLNIIPTTREDYSPCQYLMNDDRTIREILYTGNLPQDVDSAGARKFLGKKA